MPDANTLEVRIRLCPCGCQFPVPLVGVAPVLCPSCRPVHYRANARIDATTVKCEDCPATIEINPKGHTKTRCDPCRDKRKRDLRAARPRNDTPVPPEGRWTKCECGERFQCADKGPIPKWCPECKPLHRGDYRKHLAAPERDPIPCAGGCGKIIVLLRKGYKRERCDECTAKRTTELSAEWDRENPERRAERSRRSKMKRRAAKRGVEAEVFDPREVFERDRWICQICGWKIDPDATYIDPATGKPNPRYPTLDHVVPLAEGGPHTRANTRLACFDCNCKRGDRGGNEQLALI